MADLAKFGQSIWVDNINRNMMHTGKLKDMIDNGLRGMTSNPTIFEKAISGSDVYDEEINSLCKEKKSTFEIYDDLTVKDIQSAADMFKPVYERTNGLDGYVSLEINPKLAFDIDETIKEGKRLHEKVNRPNLMLKVPATDEGFKAVEELTGYGFNVNATLIFSKEQYINSTKAYISGIKKCLEKGIDVSKVNSVASIFVSRIDGRVDKILDELIQKDSSKKEDIHSLKGKTAVANSHVIYKDYTDIFSSDEFVKLKEKGANVQRALWASTSTKDPAYSDIKYVTELIAKNTVNTLPESTLENFLDHGSIVGGLTSDATGADHVIKKLKEYQIDIGRILEELLKGGVESFEKSFVSLLDTIANKKKKIYASCTK